MVLGITEYQPVHAVNDSQAPMTEENYEFYHDRGYTQYILFNYDRNVYSEQ